MYNDVSSTKDAKLSVTPYMYGKVAWPLTGLILLLESVLVHITAGFSHDHLGYPDSVVIDFIYFYFDFSTSAKLA